MIQQIALPAPKTKINKKILIIGLIAAIFLAALVGYVWLQKTGKIQGFNLEKLTAGVSLRLKMGVPGKLAEELTPGELKITLPSAKLYEQTAQAGEGITHLARKALKEYLNQKGGNPNLTPEHKIYIEDYLQKKTGDEWLKLGENVVFAEDLIAEAINKSQQLTPQQLENLKQYSAEVPLI